MYIWQSEQWPGFVYQEKQLKTQLDKVLNLQAQLLGDVEKLPHNLDREAEMDALIQNAIRTSQIEGEHLNVDSVRSSVAKQLGLAFAGQTSQTPKTEQLVAMLCDATDQLQKPLSEKQLCQWQAALFVEPGLMNVQVGKLRGPEGMQVVSQKAGREIVHFEAPPKKGLKKQLAEFLTWFNQSAHTQPYSSEPGLKKRKPSKTQQQAMLIRAGLAHLWFITLHPFEDGNGRVARALTDRALAQAEQTGVRFYCLSAAIEARRKDYYQILENTQSCKTPIQLHTGKALDVTEWLRWFLETLVLALQQGIARIDKVLLKAEFWRNHAQTALLPRQIKVLNRLLDTQGEEFQQGLAARHYQGLTKVSKATATRDLADLLEKSCLTLLESGGRSTRYTINHNMEKP